MSGAPMHSLLRRQLRRCFGDGTPQTAEWQQFVAVIDAAYHEFDRDRKMLERALDLSSQELLQAGAEMRAVVKAIPDILIRFQGNGTILDCKTGAAADSSPPMSAARERIALAARHWAGFADAANECARTQKIVTAEYTFEESGGRRSFEARIVPVVADQFVAFVRDITERLRLEDQYRHAQKMEAIGRLAGGVAHDFNNLLTVLMANLSLLRTMPATNGHMQTAINDCFDATRRAAGLTAQLLTFSRRQTIKTQEIEFNEIVGGVTKMLRRLIGEHVTMTTQLSPERLYVNADAGMMEQMLMNLAVNARDAMPNGGDLRIAVSGVEFAASGPLPPKARVGRYVAIAVSDTGTGIAPELLPRIFEPFFTTKEVGRGTGLGLATVFGIVEQHGGWIDVESRPAAGTTMTIHLPRIATPKAVETPPPEPTARGGAEAILVVEDEAPVRLLMRKVLERHGYRVTCAANAREAIEVWGQANGGFDLLLTDMVMPGGVSGRELATRLTAERPGLPVVFCSGYADGTLGGTESLRGRPDFLEKPFTVDVLLQRVRSTIDAAKRRADELAAAPGA